MAIIRGTNGDNSLRGTASADDIFGLGGNDQILGLQGNDDLFGQDGRDELRGGQGDDRIDGGASNDTAFGGEGRDTLVGGSGMDVLNGGNFVDTLRGGTGNDVLEGGLDTDFVSGGDGNDVFYSGIVDYQYVPVGDGANRSHGDSMNGGAGRDFFNILGESRHTIEDFSSQQDDRLNVNGWSFDQYDTNNDALVDATDAFSETSFNGGLELFLDADDAVPDAASVSLNDVQSLTASDFLT